MCGTSQGDTGMSDINYTESIKLLITQAKEFLAAIERNDPDFAIYSHALNLNGTSGDVITFSPVGKADDEFNNRPITEEEIERLANLIRKFDATKDSIDSVDRNYLEMLIPRIVSSLTPISDRDNNKIRTLIEIIASLLD